MSPRAPGHTDGKQLHHSWKWHSMCVPLQQAGTVNQCKRDISLFRELWICAKGRVSCVYHCKQGLWWRQPLKLIKSTNLTPPRVWELQLCNTQYHQVFSNLSMSKLNYFNGCMLLLQNIYYSIIDHTYYRTINHSFQEYKWQSQDTENLFKYLTHISSYWEVAK